MIYWGIIGAGNIAHRFAASLKAEKEAQLLAISGRNQEKLNLFAEKHEVERVYVGHEGLLSDPDITAVYVALPHGMHREWVLKALRAGKVVLCEKPAVLTREEMREIADCAAETQLLFMEAMKPRFVPSYAGIKEAILSGKIGEVTAVKATLCNNMPFEQMEKTYHTESGQGGALYDCGIYCVNWLVDAAASLGYERRYAVEKIETVIKDGVDYYVDAHLSIGGLQAELECAFDRMKKRQLIITGTKGQILAEELHRSQKYAVMLSGGDGTMTEEQHEVPYKVDDFYGEIHHFNQCLLAGKTESEIMPLQASLDCADMVDEIRKFF